MVVFGWGTRARQIGCAIIALFLVGVAIAKPKAKLRPKPTPKQETAQPEKPLDRVIVYTSPEPDLLKPKFTIGLEGAVEQMMSDPTRFFSVGEAVKVGRIVDTNKEPDLRIHVVDVAIESYEIKKSGHLFEVTNTFIETVSPEMGPKEVTPYLTKQVGRKARVVRVGMVIANTGAPGKTEAK